MKQRGSLIQRGLTTEGKSLVFFFFQPVLILKTYRTQRADFTTLLSTAHALLLC